MKIYKKIRRKIKRTINKFEKLIYLNVFFNKVENKAKIDSLSNKFINKRCFIMGNGPSLLNCDLTLLKNEVTIASNANFLIWEKINFKPTFLTVEDHLVAEDRASELNKIRGINKVFPQDLMYCLKQDIDTIFINFNRNYNGFPKFSESFQDEVYWGGTVSYMNIQLAYYLGCKEIYLIGFDHFYKVPESNKIIDSVIKSEDDDTNHIHPNYFGKGYRWHDPRVDRMEEAYIKAKEFLENKKVKVFNATIGGKLEVFERVDYNKLFNR